MAVTGRLLRALACFFLILAASCVPLVGAAQGPGSPAGGGSAAADSNAAAAPIQFRFAFMGDTGVGKLEQYAVANQLLAEHQRATFPIVLMLGDNIYGGKFARVSDVFERPYAPLLDRGVRFHATLGNHDIRCETEQMTYPGFNMGGKRAYSFAPAGDLVEFFTIDTTAIEEGLHLDQLEWLDQALASSRARWKIAFFHHSPYSPGSRHGDDAILIAKVIPILKRHGVRVVLSAHEHFFSKIATRDGIDFVISGSGGKIHKNAINFKYPGLEAGNDQLQHFVIATLTPDRLDLSAIGMNGETLYHGAIPHQPAHITPATAPK